jgi:hypothetical protein
VIGGGNASITVGQPEASQYFVGNNSLQAGQNYQWRVRCGCSNNPLIAGPWSAYDQFSLASALEARTSSTHIDSGQEVVIAPNPTNGFTQLFLNSNESSNGVISLFDITGKLVLQQNIALSKGVNILQLDLSDYKSGLYVLTTQWENRVFQTKLIIQ